jgi:hypothetical protein
LREISLATNGVKTALARAAVANDKCTQFQSFERATTRELANVKDGLVLFAFGTIAALGHELSSRML